MSGPGVTVSWPTPSPTLESVGSLWALLTWHAGVFPAGARVDTAALHLL